MKKTYELNKFGSKKSNLQKIENLQLAMNISQQMPMPQMQFLNSNDIFNAPLNMAMTAFNNKIKTQQIKNQINYTKQLRHSVELEENRIKYEKSCIYDRIKEIQTYFKNGQDNIQKFIRDFPASQLAKIKLNSKVNDFFVKYNEYSYELQSNFESKIQEFELDLQRLQNCDDYKEASKILNCYTQHDLRGFYIDSKHTMLIFKAQELISQHEQELKKQQELKEQQKIADAVLKSQNDDNKSFVSCSEQSDFSIFHDMPSTVSIQVNQSAIEKREIDNKKKEQNNQKKEQDNKQNQLQKIEEKQEKMKQNNINSKNTSNNVDNSNSKDLEIIKLKKIIEDQRKQIESKSQISIKSIQSNEREAFEKQIKLLQEENKYLLEQSQLKAQQEIAKKKQIALQKLKEKQKLELDKEELNLFSKRNDDDLNEQESENYDNLIKQKPLSVIEQIEKECKDSHNLNEEVISVLYSFLPKEHISVFNDIKNKNNNAANKRVQNFLEEILTKKTDFEKINPEIKSKMLEYLDKECPAEKTEIKNIITQKLEELKKLEEELNIDLEDSFLKEQLQNEVSEIKKLSDKDDLISFAKSEIFVEKAENQNIVVPKKENIKCDHTENESFILITNNDINVGFTGENSFVNVNDVSKFI